MYYLNAVNKNLLLVHCEIFAYNILLIPSCCLDVNFEEKNLFQIEIKYLHIKQINIYVYSTCLVQLSLSISPIPKLNTPCIQCVKLVRA